MTVSLRHLSLTITQKKPGLIITAYVLPQNHSTERIITTARAVCFNIKKKKLKKTNKKQQQPEKPVHTQKAHPLGAFKEALLNYQKKIFVFHRMGQTVVSNSSVHMKNDIDTVTENYSCTRSVLSNRNQQYSDIHVLPLQSSVV